MIEQNFNLSWHQLASMQTPPEIMIPNNGQYGAQSLTGHGINQIVNPVPTTLWVEITEDVDDNGYYPCVIFSEYFSSDAQDIQAPMRLDGLGEEYAIGDRVQAMFFSATDDGYHLLKALSTPIGVKGLTDTLYVLAACPTVEAGEIHFPVIRLDVKDGLVKTKGQIEDCTIDICAIDCSCCDGDCLGSWCMDVQITAL